MNIAIPALEYYLDREDSLSNQQEHVKPFLFLLTSLCFFVHHISSVALTRNCYKQLRGVDQVFPERGGRQNVENHSCVKHDHFAWKKIKSAHPGSKYRTNTLIRLKI